jgi:hypothetical protein
MGALRAAELAAFGMVGVGEVFEAYARGDLEDDDEVALVHEPEAHGYRARSVPMVNLRWTLDAAVTAGVITASTRDALVEQAKELFYPDRSYARLIEDAAAAGVDASERKALAAWLPKGQVDVKRRDASAMLHAMKGHLARGDGRTAPRFHFEHTTYWEALRASCDDDPVAGRIDDVLDELRLDPAAYERARLRVERRQALAPCATATWGARALDRALALELKIAGDYDRLRDRARAKCEALEARGLAEPGTTDAAIDRAALVRWYFGEVLGRPVPQDLRAHATANGFADDQLFVRAMLREHLFRSHGPSGTEPQGGRE